MGRIEIDFVGDPVTWDNGCIDYDTVKEHLDCAICMENGIS